MGRESITASKIWSNWYVGYVSTIKDEEFYSACLVILNAC